MRTLTRISMAVALLLGAFVTLFAAPVVVVAQEASPAADECPVTTPDENVAIVEAYIIAYDNAHAEGIDDALHDEYSDNLDRGAGPLDPLSNDDEALLAAGFEASFPGSIYIINELAALGDNRVVADLTIQITHAADPSTGETVELPAPVLVPSISIITIECGQIVSGRSVSDGLVLILGIGLVVSLPEATPEP